MCNCYFGHYSLKYSVDESATPPKIIYIGGAIMATDQDPSVEGQSVSARGRSRGDVKYMEPLVQDHHMRQKVTASEIAAMSWEECVRYQSCMRSRQSCAKKAASK